MKNKLALALVLTVLLMSSFSVAADAFNTGGVSSSLQNVGNRLKLTNAWNGLVNKVGNVLEWYKADIVQDPQSPDGYKIVYNEQYAVHRKVVDFFIFFTIFMSIAYLALSNWFEKKGASVALAFALGLALAIPIVTIVPKGGVSITMFFPFAKNIIYIIIMMVFFYILTREGLMKDSKVLAFFLAALITYLAFTGFSFMSGEGLGGIPGARMFGDMTNKYLGTYRDSLQNGFDLMEQADKLVNLDDDSKNTRALILYRDARTAFDAAKVKINKTLEDTSKPPSDDEKIRLKQEIANIDQEIEKIQGRISAVSRLGDVRKEYETALIESRDINLIKTTKQNFEDMYNKLK